MFMIIALIAFFIASVFLMWQRTLSPVLGGILSFSSAAILLYIVVRHISLSLKLQRAMKRHKAKWVGSVAIVSGLSTSQKSDSILLLNRRDELIVESPRKTITLPLEAIEKIGIISSENIVRNSDYDIAFALRFNMVPNFAYIREYLRRNPADKKKRMILIKPIKPAEKYERSNMIVLIETSSLSNLNEFLQRPEIASISCVVSKKDKKKKPLAHERDNQQKLHRLQIEEKQRRLEESKVSLQQTDATNLWIASDQPRDEGDK